MSCVFVVRESIACFGIIRVALTAEWGLLDVCNGWHADDQNGALKQYGVCFSNVYVHVITRIALEEARLLCLLNALPWHEDTPLTDAMDDQQCQQCQPEGARCEKNTSDSTC